MSTLSGDQGRSHAALILRKLESGVPNEIQATSALSSMLEVATTHAFAPSHVVAHGTSPQVARRAPVETVKYVVAAADIEVVFEHREGLGLKATIAARTA